MSDFETSARLAQELYGERDFVGAACFYHTAQAQAPNELETARMQRGWGMSNWQLSRERGRHAPEEMRTQAIDGLLESLVVFDRVVKQTADEDPAAHLSALSQRGEGRAVLGRVMLLPVIEEEIANELTRSQAQIKGKHVIDTWFEPAKADLDMVEAHTGRTDQHKINLLSRLSVAHSLYGDWERGSAYASKARELGPQAESNELVDPARLSAAYVVRAKLRASARGSAAVVINRLVASPLPLRRWALKAAVRAVI